MLLTTWTTQLLRAATRFIYPPVCLWCEKLLGTDRRESHAFCESCESALAPAIPFRCQKCSAPVGPHLETSQGCIHCIRDSARYEQVISLGPYEGDLRSACLQGKHAGGMALVQNLTQLLCQREQERLLAWEADLVIPVPHHWTDRLRAGHASDLVAETLGRILMLPVEQHILVKVKRTPKQQTLSASARRKNLRSSFHVSRSAGLEGCRILLADDILTTGTTAQRCTQALLKAGAAVVNVAVLARGILA